jgi:hypothetical protein
MPSDSLSEKDRLRLARLMKAPLIPVPHQAYQRTEKSFMQFCQEAAGRVVNQRWNRQRATIAGAAIVCLAGIVLAVVLKAHLPAESIQLQALERQGQLQIRWDANAGPIREAREAKLFIIDGSQRLFVTLDPARLRRGRVSYERQTDRVELRMAVAEPDGKLIEEQVSFAGSRPVNPAPAQPELFARETAPAAKPPAEVVATAATVPHAPALIEPKQPGALRAEHRSRKKPTVLSGTALPFTCGTGDVFHKTDAPTGWGTFECRAKNVWSLMRDQTDERSTSRPSPNATTLTAKPATASTI